MPALRDIECNVTSVRIHAYIVRMFRLHVRSRAVVRQAT
jgi:hypothetical protein